jgi:predicted RNA binding protein YcfA (HicA-like mRNA interferase family)
MPPFGPISRRELIQALRRAGFEGPFAGGRHAFMVKGDRSIVVPNPHRSDVGRDLLSRLLKQAGIAKKDWESL